MSKYPYIGKSRTTPVTVLFTSRLSGFCFSSGKYSRCWNETVFDDVTSVFLSGKKIEVKSQVESKLVQLSVFKAGEETRTGGKKPVNLNAPFILISKDLQVTFEDDRSFFDAYKMDGIKLPKFDNPSEFVFPELERPIKHFDCVCTKCGGRCCIGNCDEWPKPGDEVLVSEKPGVTIHESNKEIFGAKDLTFMGKFKNSYGKEIAVIQNEKGACFVVISKLLEKPKTPEQKLRDDLINYIDEKNQLWIKTGRGHIDSTTVFEFISDALMSEYNITKKVKDND